MVSSSKYVVKNEQDPVMTNKESSVVGMKSTSDPVEVVEDRTQIASRLKHAVERRPQANRSTDVVPLSHGFDIMRKQLRSVISSCKHYQVALSSLDQARIDVATTVAKMAEKTPLADATQNSIAKRNKKATAEMTTLTDKFNHDVVDYATEWERIISSRVDAELKEASELHKRLEHYQSKVSKLRKQVNDKQEKDKKDHKLSEKLERNEDKLELAWSVHEAYASKTCHLLEEVTTYGWKDLYPLMTAILKFDDAFGKSMAKAFDGMHNLVSELQQAYNDNDVAPEDAPMMTPVAGAAATVDSDSTGSYHDENATDDSPIVADIDGTGGASAPTPAKTATRGSGKSSSKGVMGMFKGSK